MALPKPKKEELSSYSDKPEIIIFGLLAQVAILQAVPLYVPDGNPIVTSALKELGVKFHTTQLPHGSALYYKHGDGYHYLKLVGPNCPKGGGFYLVKKMPSAEFIRWLEAFTRGVLFRDLRDRVDNPNSATIELIKVMPNDPFSVVANV